MQAIEIYSGIRGPVFQKFVSEILSLSRLPVHHHFDLSANPLYEQAFTHKTADATHNYEYLEFLGDVTLNKAIAWYLSERFPQLKCPLGVKVLTRLKINLISKKSFAGFAKRLSFWNFISADAETRQTKMDKVLEDVFESFFGATELLVDERLGHGEGYKVCYRVIESILDDQPLSLRYDRLFDAKTRLKEVFDFFGPVNLGTLRYATTKVERMHHTLAFRDRNGESTELGRGSAPLKAVSEQYASQIALSSLRKQGFIKPIPEEYSFFDT